ncbi:basic proline-rich protein-like [Phodopus roborovskii]|uniref:basic proline-rich protein-like n=1 Tax=Phodopus roborovskii TaxID=109678 RepID=UPI0021E464DF|nr:basic proline-rich protein-like [Phodopus roborovskii]
MRPPGPSASRSHLVQEAVSGPRRASSPLWASLGTVPPRTTFRPWEMSSPSQGPPTTRRPRGEPFPYPRWPSAQAAPGPGARRAPLRTLAAPPLPRPGHPRSRGGRPHPRRRGPPARSARPRALPAQASARPLPAPLRSAPLRSEAPRGREQSEVAAARNRARRGHSPGRRVRATGPSRAAASGARRSASRGRALGGAGWRQRRPGARCWPGLGRRGAGRRALLGPLRLSGTRVRCRAGPPAARPPPPRCCRRRRRRRRRPAFSPPRARAARPHPPPPPRAPPARPAARARHPASASAAPQAPPSGGPKPGPRGPHGGRRGARSALTFSRPNCPSRSGAPAQPGHRGPREGRLRGSLDSHSCPSSEHLQGAEPGGSALLQLYPRPEGYPRRLSHRRTSPALTQQTFTPGPRSSSPASPTPAVPQVRSTPYSDLPVTCSPTKTVVLTSLPGTEVLFLSPPAAASSCIGLKCLSPALRGLGIGCRACEADRSNVSSRGYPSTLTLGREDFPRHQGTLKPSKPVSLPHKNQVSSLTHTFLTDSRWNTLTRVPALTFLHVTPLTHRVACLRNSGGLALLLFGCVLHPSHHICPYPVPSDSVHACQPKACSGP